MEVKKSPRASLESKRLLFAEIGTVLSLLFVLGAFQYSTRERHVATLTADYSGDDTEEIVPITMETPPEVPLQQVVMLSDQIDIVEDEIPTLDIISLDDTDIAVEIYDYRGQVEEEEADEEPTPFVMVESKPRFMGQDANEFSRWVAQNLVYPEVAKENGVQGRVTLGFTIRKDGTLSDVKVLRGVDASLDKEALRVVSSSPKWEPGHQRDRAVNVSYTFPVIFKLR